MNKKWKKRTIYCIASMTMECLAVLLLAFWSSIHLFDATQRHIVSVIIQILAVVQIAQIAFPVRKICFGIWAEAKALQNEKEHVDALTREIIGNVTHDLKTPLTAIQGYSQGILDGVAAEPDKLTKYVTTIRNKSNDMSALVDELAFFAKIYQKDIQYHWEEVPAVDYVTACVSEASLDLEMKEISLVFKNEISPETKVFIDKEKIKRVLNNIIGNSSKYIQKELGLLRVRLQENEDFVTIQIADNGIGIKKEELPRIFERFYRTDSSRNSKTGGSGLGLSIAQKIVDEHNGYIWANSEVGQGTQIYIGLPKVQEQIQDEK